MPIQTYVENGCVVGYLPSVGARVRVPLRDCVRQARATMTQDELNVLDGVSGDTVGGVLDEVGAGRIARKIKKAIKKVAKNKIVRGIAKLVKKAVPPPFNVAVQAADGAAKFAKALSKGSKKAKKLRPAVRAAAAGRISPKQLTKAARKAGVKPAIAADAAVIKRVSMQAVTDPEAAATMRLANDITSTEPADQARAQQALEENPYDEPVTSRDDGAGQGMDADPMESEDADFVAPMTEDSVGPDAVEPYEDTSEYSEAE